MRVISGKYKGKNLKGFNIEGTRPTMDRVKESLFAMLQTNTPNSVCLDLFAGSGALGIEALSMGAACCYFVDHNHEAIKILKENTTNISDAYIINSDYKKYLKETDLKYDIIFLDPPYHYDLLNKAIKFIEEYDLLTDKGIIVCEYEEIKPETKLNLIKYKKYGTKHIAIYKK